jgi:hypothetical protein
MSDLPDQALPPAAWKKGRGTLGRMAPLLGRWAAQAPTPAGGGGDISCVRTFEPVLGGAYIQLDAEWHMGPGRTYRERALFGVGENKRIAFSSFTSDGKKSAGVEADGSDVHPDAIAFEAEMPAGIARMIYWPAEEGFHFAVESRTKRGWNRFVTHHYRADRA